MKLKLRLLVVSDQKCPEDIIQEKNLCTGLAFDNFDRFVDTDTGKDTLHDTVGIIFQNIVDYGPIEQGTVVEENIGNDNRECPITGSKRRRTFDVVMHELEPYLKTPSLIQILQPLESPSRLIVPSDLKSLVHINFIWMLSHCFKVVNTPMWVGFNSLIYDDTSAKQKISYLTTINSSPTNKSVVIETMKQSQQVARECDEEYMQVSYDLAIAKIALQIQCSEKPRFDNIFIHLGSFHIQMSFFKTIGKFIDDCGVTNLMVNSMMLANGSVNSFIAGKHFNRCKRLHPILSLAFKILHFERFIQDNDIEFTNEMKKYLLDFISIRSTTPIISNNNLIDLLNNYEAYKEKTLHGEHGKTAQFYIIYTTFVDYYLMFSSSIRTANFKLFKFVLPKLANLFFTFNLHNYSRYLVRYHDNLLNVDETHPGLRELFEQGSFGIKRTSKSFSRQPIDLMLEQTINADAGNKLTGIVHSTNSIGSRQRWCRSRSIRSKITAHVMETAGLRKRQYVTADLEKSRIKKSFDKIT